MPNYTASLQYTEERCRAAERTGLETVAGVTPAEGFRIPLSPPLFKHLRDFLIVMKITLKK